LPHSANIPRPSSKRSSILCAGTIHPVSNTGKRRSNRPAAKATEGNYIAGITVVAAPVWKAPGRPSHALVGIGLGGALGRKAIEALGAALVAAARTLSEQMGGA
jgi:hypothetical protein